MAVVVVGAGPGGVACASSLAARYPNQQILLIAPEGTPSADQSRALHYPFLLDPSLDPIVEMAPLGAKVERHAYHGLTLSNGSHRGVEDLEDPEFLAPLGWVQALGREFQERSLQLFYRITRIIDPRAPDWQCLLRRLQASAAEQGSKVLWKTHGTQSTRQVPGGEGVREGVGQLYATPPNWKHVAGSVARLHEDDNNRVVSVELDDGSTIDAILVVLAAGNWGTPRILARSQMLSDETVPVGDQHGCVQVCLKLPWERWRVERTPGPLSHRSASLFGYLSLHWSLLGLVLQFINLKLPRWLAWPLLQLRPLYDLIFWCLELLLPCLHDALYTCVFIPRKAQLRGRYNPLTDQVDWQERLTSAEDEDDVKETVTEIRTTLKSVGLWPLNTVALDQLWHPFGSAWGETHPGSRLRHKRLSNLFFADASILGDPSGLHPVNNMVAALEVTGCACTEAIHAAAII